MTKTIAATFLGTLAAGALIVGITRIMGPIPLSISQTTINKQSAFDVTGSSEITTAPDRATVTIGIQQTGNTVSAVQDKGNEIINAVTQHVRTLGVEASDIKTTNYNLNPTYDMRTGTQTITGYSLNINVGITIKDFSKINEIIDTATRDGANQIGGISFTLSEEKQLEVENQAREQAIKRAKDKAESLSRIAGIRLGKIINVIENGNNPMPRPMLYLAQDKTEGSFGVPTDVQPGSTTFTMTVTLSYETL